MKKLTRLREPVCNLDGSTVKEITGQEIVDGKETPIITDATFISLLATRIYQSERKTDAMLLRKIARELYAGGDEQVFEDAEIKVMQGVLDESGLYAFARAHCQEIIDDAMPPIRPKVVEYDSDGGVVN